MNRSRQIVNQGLAALLVLMLVMPFSAFAESRKKKSHRAKQQTAKTTTPAPEAEKQDAQTPDKGETKTDTKSEAPAKPSANDETAGPVVVNQQQTQTQTQTQPQAPTQPQDQQPIKRSAAQPPSDRIGVDLNNPLNLSVHDAVVMALNRNLDIAVNRVNVQLSEFSLRAAQGIYDVNFTSTSDFTSQTTPALTTISGSVGGASTTRTLDYNAGINQFVEKSGGFYSVQWNNNRSVSNNRNNQINPTFANNLTVNLRQPLVRNLKIDSNRRQILVAKKNLDLSDIQFKQIAINTINRVQDAYWDLVFALKNEQITRDSVDLAVVQLDNNRKRVEAGDLAPIEVISAQAQVDNSRVNVIAALQQVTSAENVLKGLLSDNPGDNQFWSAMIVPTTPVDYQPLNMTLTDAFRLAIANRTELQTIKDQIALNQINTDFFRDQLKPQVDFIGFYTTRGLSGTPTIVSAVQTNGADIAFANQANAQLAGHVPGFIPIIVPPPTFIPGVTSVGSQFIGRQLTALGNLFRNEFRSYSFGVSIAFPFRNRTAKANLGSSLASGRQLELEQKQTIQNIQIDVRNALQAVESARQRIDAAKSGRVNAEAQLAGEEQKFKAGLSQNFLVLQRQNELSIARGQELRANTDYNKAIADLQRVLAITLDSAGVTVASPITMTDVAPKPTDKKNK